MSRGAGRAAAGRGRAPDLSLLDHAAVPFIASYITVTLMAILRTDCSFWYFVNPYVRSVSLILLPAISVRRGAEAQARRGGGSDRHVHFFIFSQGNIDISGSQGNIDISGTRARLSRR